MPGPQSSLSDVASEGGARDVVLWRRSHEPQTLDGADDIPSKESVSLRVDAMGTLTTGTSSGSLPTPSVYHRHVTRSLEEPSSSIKHSSIEYAEKSSGAFLAEQEEQEEEDVEVRLIATEVLQSAWKKVNSKTLLKDFYKHMERMAELWAKNLSKKSFRILDKKGNIPVDDLKNQPIGCCRTFLVKFTD